MQNLDATVGKIIQNPLFLKLKDVIENNPWHDHESVYDHLLKTYNIATKQIDGHFISNKTANKLFLNFVNEKSDEVKIKDLMLITALIHDAGKILHYKEEGQEKPLRHEDQNGNTKMPGHEYWSSTIAPLLLKNTGLSEKNIQRITKVVRLHDTFNDNYLANTLEIEELIDDIKARAEGLYKEALFNIYCDEFTAKVSENSIKKIKEVFNHPYLYSQREYFIK